MTLSSAGFTPSNEGAHSSAAVLHGLTITYALWVLYVLVMGWAKSICNRLPPMAHPPGMLTCRIRMQAV